jgi:hypothetical protein
VEYLFRSGPKTRKGRHVGHIPGAAIVELTRDKGKIVFSGDLGRPNNAPTVGCDLRVGYVSLDFSEVRPGAFFIGLDQPRIANNIGGQYSSKSSLDALFRHVTSLSRVMGEILCAGEEGVY